MAKPSDSKKKRPAASQAAHEGNAKKPRVLGKGKPAPKPAPPPANLSRKEKKELARAKKAKRQKNFTLIQEVVGLWEDLRRHDVSAEKRSKLITAVLSKVKGRVAELAASHTASRVIQACAKYGSAAERAAILEELSPKLLELSKSSYGHFVVSKLINLAPKEQLPGILKQFRGQIPALVRHPAGAHVIDDLWAAADAKQRNTMAAEFYGREYVLFEGGTINNAAGAPARLSDLMAGVDGAKRRAIVLHLSHELMPVMEKGLLDPPLVHRLVAEFLEASPASLVADAVESLSGEPLLHMVHTKEGARAACMALAYGTAKDRKKAVKALKGHVGTMARDEWGHLVLLTALSVVDDTALLKKFIVAELQKDLEELCAHRYAHRVLLQLLHPYCGRYLPPQLLAIVQPPQKSYDAAGAGAGGAAGDAGAEGSGAEEAAAGAQSDDEDEDEEGGAPSRPTSGPLGVSKKDSATRRRELFGSGANGLGSALAQLCAAQADALLRSQAACDVVVEVCGGGEGGVLEECAGAEAVSAVHEAVAAAVAAGAQGEGEEEPLLVNFFASRALRRLVLESCSSGDGGGKAGSGGEASRAAATRCAEALWARGGLQGNCARWVGTHAAKVLAALVRCGSSSVRAAAAAELAPLVAPETVEAWAEHLAGPTAQHAKQHKGGKRKKPAAAEEAAAEEAQQPAAAGKQAGKQAAKQQQQPAGGKQPALKRQKQKQKQKQ